MTSVPSMFLYIYTWAVTKLFLPTQFNCERFDFWLGTTNLVAWIEYKIPGCLVQGELLHSLLYAAPSHNKNIAFCFCGCQMLFCITSSTMIFFHYMSYFDVKFLHSQWKSTCSNLQFVFFCNEKYFTCTEKYKPRYAISF